MASGHASARGSACSKERRVAELLDTAARRGVDGGRGYGEGVAAMASAMAWESEGEELERRGGVWEVRGREGSRFTALAERGRRRGGEQVRGTHAVLAVEHLPACLAGSSSLARCWAGPAGGPGAGRQVSLFYFLSVFCFLILLQLC